MFKANNILVYKIIAISCVVILCWVQLQHIRNIYKLEEEVYNIEEKNTIRKEYEESIINDKVYPGGIRVLDSIINGNLPELERLALTDSTAFRKRSDQVNENLFSALRQKSNMDSLLTEIGKRHKFPPNIIYALFVEQIDIAPETNLYFPMFTRDRKTVPGNYPYLRGKGALIGGTLTNLNPTTLTSAIKVSTPTAHSYRINFALYADRSDRWKQVIMKSLPATLLSVFSIIAMLVIFFLTFSNWVKQRKMTEMKSDFINTISHEFQTPLTAIIIANKTIANENEQLQNEKLASLNAIIKRQSDRLTLLVRQVTESSNDQLIKADLHKWDVNKLLRDIIADFQLSIDSTTASVELQALATSDLVYMDRLHFTTIVLNLLSNGLKYNHKEQKRIIVTTTNVTEDVVILSIKDNGDGMSNKVRKRMFSRFYRDTSLTGGNAPGLGMGLYYTKQCLDAHKWEYEVKTKPGGGTEFIITMPVVGDEAAAKR